MLELPEAHTIARQWNETVRGKRIVSIVAGKTPHRFAFYTGDPAAYPSLLANREAGAARAIGGMVEIDVGENCLLFGDGASPRYFAPQEKAPEKHQLMLRFADESIVTCTVRMYGGIWAYRAGTNDNAYYCVACEKPAPLSDAFDAAYFDSLYAACKANMSVKAFLATQQRIPGLGNGCLQDILLRARVHPKSKLAALQASEIDAVFHAVRDTLALMTSLGGRDVEKDLFGNAGGYRSALSQKTVRMPCPVCGGIVVRQAYLGGNVYFCPDCQPLKQ